MKSYCLMYYILLLAIVNHSINSMELDEHIDKSVENLDLSEIWKAYKENFSLKDHCLFVLIQTNENEEKENDLFLKLPLELIEDFQRAKKIYCNLKSIDWHHTWTKTECFFASKLLRSGIADNLILSSALTELNIFKVHNHYPEGLLIIIDGALDHVAQGNSPRKTQSDSIQLTISSCMNKEYINILRLLYKAYPKEFLKPAMQNNCYLKEHILLIEDFFLKAHSLELSKFCLEIMEENVIIDVNILLLSIAKSKDEQACNFRISAANRLGYSLDHLCIFQLSPTTELSLDQSPLMLAIAELNSCALKLLLMQPINIYLTNSKNKTLFDVFFESLNCQAVQFSNFNSNPLSFFLLKPYLVLFDIQLEFLEIFKNYLSEKQLDMVNEMDYKILRRLNFYSNELKKSKDILEKY